MPSPSTNPVTLATSGPRVSRRANSRKTSTGSRNATPAPTAMPPGILTRFRELARRIKASAGYTDAIGQALGIVGPNSAGPDLATITPQISLRTVGDKVEVLWNKQGMEAVEIHKDSGSDWQFLATDTRPNYFDTTPFPSPAAHWKYRAIYTQDSQKVGQLSNVAEITVGDKPCISPANH